MLNPSSFLEMPSQILDVRSPSEYSHGHIPGALNLPLFSDNERAKIGIIYKQQGHDAAVLEGLRIVGPKMANLVEEAILIAPEKVVAIHCWRGGMRSSSVAWLLKQAGFQVELLEGGYKAYRKWVQLQFANALNLKVLGGPTGSGKTRILRELKALGEQVIDLEFLANHKGSTFGSLGEKPQPTIEQFENDLVQLIASLNTTQAIWIEDESRKIGSIYFHNDFWDQLNSGPLLNIEIPDQLRIEQLVEDYGNFKTEDLATAIVRIGKRLGPQHLKSALEALHNHDLHKVAEIVLFYYDKAYRYSQTRRLNPIAEKLVFNHADPKLIAQEILEYSNKLNTWNRLKVNV
jgi:tRNA 2-selenouridine synthase